MAHLRSALPAAAALYVAASVQGEELNPVLVGQWENRSGSVNRLVVSGHYAYLGGDAGLQIIDISDPANPKLASSYPVAGWLWDIALFDHYAYLATLGEIEIVDVSDPKNPKSAGVYRPEGRSSVLALSVSGQLAFLAQLFFDPPVSGVYGRLFILSLEDPVNPHLLSVYTPPVQVGRVAVLGQYAFMAGLNETFRVLDINDPTQPRLVSGLDIRPGIAFPNRITVSGNYAYLLDSAPSGGLYIVDISKPLQPRLVSQYGTDPFRSTEGFALSGTRGYFARNGLEVLDLSNPETPRRIGKVEIVGDLAVSGDYVYVANQSGLFVFDTVDRVQFSAPVFTGYSDEGAAIITVRGGVPSGGLASVEYSALPGTATPDRDYTPVSGVLRFGPGATERTFQVPISGTNLDPGPRTVHLQLTNPSGAILGSLASAELSISERAPSVEFSTSLLSVAADDGKVSVTVRRRGSSRLPFNVDLISTPLTATPLLDYAVPDGTLSFAAGELAKTVAITISSGFRDGADKSFLLQLKNPTAGVGVGPDAQVEVKLNCTCAPLWSQDLAVRQVGLWPSSGDSITAMAAAGKYVCVLQPQAGLKIIDVSNPAQLSLAGVYAVADAREVAMSGNYVFLAGDRIRVIDISRPTSPQLVATYPARPNPGASFSSLSVSDQRVVAVQQVFDPAIGEPQKRLVVFDALNPSEPSIISGACTGCGWSGEQAVGLSGNYAFMACERESFRVLDVSDWTQPKVVSGLDIAPGIAFPEKIAVQGQYAYVLDRNSGIYVIDITNPVQPRLVGQSSRIWTQLSRVAVAETRGYITTTSDFGLEILDLAEPATPRLLAAIKAPGAGPFAVEGDFLYLVQSGGLSVFDLADRIQFSASRYVGFQQEGVANIAVRRTGLGSGGATVEVTASPDPPVAGDIDRPFSAVLQFGPGASEQTVRVPIARAIPLGGGTRSVRLGLANLAGGGVLGPVSTAELVIVDAPPTIQFTASELSVTEKAGTASVTVERNTGLALPVSVRLISTPMTAVPGEDYIPPDLVLTFGPNERTKIITCPILQDTAFEGPEAFELRLASPIGGARVGSSAVLTVTIEADAAGFSQPTYVANEDSHAAEITVIRSTPLDQSLSVEYSTRDLTAISGKDYLAQTDTLTFAPGQLAASITVPLIDTFAVEGPRMVRLELRETGGMAPSTPISTAVLAITDDERPVTVDLGFRPDLGTGGVRAIAVQPDGKIILGGNFDAPSTGEQWTVLRLNPDGSVDRSFKQAPVTSELTLALDPGGQVWLVGQTRLLGDSTTVLRLKEDGSLDSAFRSDFESFGLSFLNQVTLTFQPDERFSWPESSVSISRVPGWESPGSMRMVPANRSFNPGAGPSDTDSRAGGPTSKRSPYSRTARLCRRTVFHFDRIPTGSIARRNSDGSLDGGFLMGTGFRLGALNETPGLVRALLVLPDGKILAAGAFTSYEGRKCSSLVRLNADG